MSNKFDPNLLSQIERCLLETALLERLFRLRVMLEQGKQSHANSAYIQSLETEIGMGEDLHVSLVGMGKEGAGE